MKETNRVAKNTVFLYFRMAITMLVQLYTARVVLDTLGVIDYGLWSVIAALIMSSSFITAPLCVATQRFLNVELGKGNTLKAGNIFSESFIMYCILCLGIILIFETIGVWFLNTRMTIPGDKIFEANFLLQLSLASFIVSILKIPYDAIIIAYERFQFFTIISIAEAVLKLMVMFLLQLHLNDSQLLTYGWLMLAVNSIITILYKIYCNSQYIISRFKFIWDKSLLRELSCFSGFSALGAFANVSTTQGISLLINIFFGVVVNAAFGIAMQVSNVINQFVSNYQTAIYPRLIKEWSRNEIKNLHALIYNSSKFSFILLMALVCPLLYNIDFILHLWLENVPAYTSSFCRYVLIFILIESVGTPLWISIQATGSIRQYQILISICIFSTVLLSYLCLKMGGGPQCVLIIKCFVALLCFFVRLIYAKRLVKLSISKFFKTTVVPVAIISACCFFVMYLCYICNQNSESWSGLLASTLVFVLAYIPMIWLLGMNSQERTWVKNYFQKQLLVCTKK